ncbi:right-handed parallel beta-helix repeat-containing protein [Thalassotalea fonticola]|uniref:Right-handed parallel beta-helix repeat-containing protein n=1 Tax=Thalassotalea fonticola TaxID=3065649 RepID=A0ABZ0GIE1_9GAMM|nr:right-handed parallel beta-helix repeat-containing protein [Colwelliaceae bacterium S1-1]
MKHLFALLVNFAVVLPAFASQYFVATNGNDDNDGSIDSPFKHIQYAADKMDAGDVTYIRGGNYFEQVTLSGVNGEEEKPYTFKAYQDEKVTLEGTIAINNQWTKYQGDIYQTKLEQPIWQLFVNDKSMTSARWPNGNWYDRSVWDKKQSMMWPEKSKGKFGTHYNKELAELETDLTGAIAIVNSGSFKTYQKKVTEHKKGQDHFSYDTKGANEHFSYKGKIHRQGYFLEGKLALLDEENEWFFDPETNQLYLWAENGVSPDTLNVRGKVQSYAFIIKRSSHINLEGINFFATTFDVSRSSFIKVADSELMYPSYSKRMLGDASTIDVTKMLVKKEHDLANYQLQNCKIAYTDGPAIEMNGTGNLVENCYMHDIDYSCTHKGGFTLNMMNAKELVFRRNTIHTTGCSELFKAGVRNRIELNDLSDSGHLQNDGSMVQLSVKQQPNGIVRYNWVHDSVKQGIRFDNKNTPNAPYGNNGHVFNNVAWNTDRIYFKGDNHFVFNNLSFGSHLNDLIVSSNKVIQGHNLKTITRNNISNKFSGNRTKPRKKYPVPGIVDHNWDGVTLGKDVRTQLRDPDNLDFRPKADSDLVDAGVVIKDKINYFLGKAPDIGPYEFGAEDYWIPGHQAEKASKPVPPLAAVKVKLDADLMWLFGYQASIHQVYFGDDENAVKSATSTSALYQGEFSHNIFTPKSLENGKTYYWRVDAVRADKVIKGDVWQFSVEDKTNNSE